MQYQLMHTQVCHLRHEPLPCNVQGPFRYRLLGVLATVVLETPKHLHWLIPWEWSMHEVLLSKERDLCRRHHTPSMSHSCRDGFQKTISKGPRSSCGKPGFGGTSAIASSSWTEWVVRFVVFNMYLLKLIQIIWMGRMASTTICLNSSSNKIFLSLVACQHSA